MQTATMPQASSSPSFSDLFKPLQPIGGGLDKPPGATSQGLPAATDNPPPNAPGSVASGNGAVSAADALAGLKHTEISSVSGTGIPGQAGTTPLTGVTGAQAVSLGGMVQGEWAVNIMDALLPAAVVAGFYYMGVKLRKSELQLTASEKATISPIMQKCLDSILLNFDNPWSALAVTVVAIYGGKIMEKGLVAFVDKKQEKQQDEALKEKIAAADKIVNPGQYDPANQSANDIQAGNVIVTGYPFTEDDVRRRMKDGKCGREKAINFLKKKFGLQ